MHRLVFGLAALLVVSAPLAQGVAPFDETAITLRHEMLRLINRDRVRHGLQPVQIDAEASAIAESYCRAQIRNGTTGHFTNDGQTPYMRYSFAGGNDGVSENAAAWSASYSFSERALYEMTRQSQEAMMAERPPNDGHRRTILDPYATHVGIGMAWERGEFRIAQEFLRRYVSWTRPLPRAAGLADLVQGRGKAAPGYRVEAISVHHEPIPEWMPAHVASGMKNYRLPDKRRDYLPRLRTFVHPNIDGTFRLVREEYTDGRKGDFYSGEDGGFNFEVPFRDGPGVYTVVVWVARKGEKTPIAASNISIRVDRPASAPVLANTAARSAR
jgi:uncharacterized protein YkwD